MIQIEKTLRATLRMNNDNDTLRAYAISAEVQMGEEKNVQSITSGAVLKEGMAVATFSRYGSEFSVSYINLDLEERNAVNVAIDAFVNEVAEAITATESINI